MEKISEDVQKSLNIFLSEVKTKYESLATDYRSKQEESENQNTNEDLLLVSQDDLCRLIAQIQHQKTPPPKVKATKTMAPARATDALKEELKQTRQQLQNSLAELSYLKKHCETAVSECQQEKQDNIQLRQEVEVLSQQLSQQSEYCSGLGSACCTLLWRVSKNEDTIQSILIGSKIEEFLALVSSTLNTYVITYKLDWPDLNSEESQFVHALCGITTNIVASAFGREFLITSPQGRQLVDTYIVVLEEAPSGKSARLKNLILIALNNMSINQNGIKYLSSKRGIIKLLAWILQEKVATENQAFYFHTLRLIQCLISVESNLNMIHELEELPKHIMQHLQTYKNRLIREFAQEVSADIQNHIHRKQ
ncbi:heat shock factor 2-binding protein-like [Crassostrea virginica]